MLIEKLDIPGHMLMPYSGRNPHTRVRQTLRFRNRNQGQPLLVKLGAPW